MSDVYLERSLQAALSIEKKLWAKDKTSNEVKRNRSWELQTLRTVVKTINEAGGDKNIVCAKSRPRIVAMMINREIPKYGKLSGEGTAPDYREGD